MACVSVNIAASVGAAAAQTEEMRIDVSRNSCSASRRSSNHLVSGKICLPFTAGIFWEIIFWVGVEEDERHESQKAVCQPQKVKMPELLTHLLPAFCAFTPHPTVAFSDSFFFFAVLLSIQDYSSDTRMNGGS
jgi:hypothetical protein